MHKGTIVKMDKTAKEIYEPSEDSYLLSKYVKAIVNPGMKVLDVGCGSGIQSETALTAGASVLGVDINQNAISHCIKSSYTKGGSFVVSDLFSKVPSEKYDCIIFNAPYLPDEKDPEAIKDYTTGGKKGYEIVGRFLDNASDYLTDTGCILLLFSSKTNKTVVDKFIFQRLFECELLEEQSIFFEKLYCYKITKSPSLITLENKGVSKLIFHARGARGYVYAGIYKEKKVIVKIASPKKPQCSMTLILEAKWLTRVNKLGIGPKLYLASDDFVIMEFIPGISFEKYLEHLEKNTSISTNKKNELGILLLSIFEQAAILDQNGIQKNEFSRPLRNVIVTPDGKVVLIDFERAKISENSCNISQYVQFLASGRILPHGFTFERKNLIEFSKEYMAMRDIKPLRKYVLSILNK